MQRLNKEETREALSQLYPFKYDHEIVRAAHTMELGEAIMFEPYEWPFSSSIFSAYPLNAAFKRSGSKKMFKLKTIAPHKKYLLTRVR